MNSEELNLVEQLIDEETDSEKLVRLRKIICDKISSCQKNGTALDKVQIDILLKRFVDFSDEIGSSNRNKHCILRYFNYNFDISEEYLKVYHLLGLGEKELKSGRNIGDLTLAPYEEELNQYNLTLRKPLTSRQIQMLERQDAIEGGK